MNAKEKIANDHRQKFEQIEKEAPREVRRKMPIYNSKETETSNKEIMRNNSKFRPLYVYNCIRYNKSDIFGVMVDFTFTIFFVDMDFSSSMETGEKN